jgi:hypothetical protein
MLAVALLAGPIPPATSASAERVSTRASDCVSGGANEASASRGSRKLGDESPTRFSPAMYRFSFAIEASLDGFEGESLPISIETICRVRRRLQREAAQLAGADGVAVILPRTRVVKDRRTLQDPQRTEELAGADTATLRARLLRPTEWQENEDGDPVPTFRASRIDITD